MGFANGGQQSNDRNRSLQPKNSFFKRKKRAYQLDKLLKSNSEGKKNRTLKKSTRQRLEVARREGIRKEVFAYLLTLAFVGYLLYLLAKYVGFL